MSSEVLVNTSARVVQTQRDQVMRFPTVRRGQLTGTSATLYTAPTGTTPTGATQHAELRSISLCNTDASARTVTLYLVESGGAIGANRMILSAASIPAGETWILDCGDEFPLESGETIRGLASVADVVTYRLNILQVT